MIKNEKGVTLFEMLVSISVGSILIMMLMGMMSSVLITRNAMDYQNRTSEEIFYINERMKSEFNRLGLRSVEELFSENTEHYVFLLTSEYVLELVDGRYVPNIDDQYSMILHLNLTSGGLYYGPEIEFNYDTLSFNNPSLRRINADNITIESNSTITLVPLRAAQFPVDVGEECTLFDNFDCEEKISRAFFEFDFHISAILTSGNTLPPRQYFSTLYY